jgi:hypothetical protein
MGPLSRPATMYFGFNELPSSSSNLLQARLMGPFFPNTNYKPTFEFETDPNKLLQINADIMTSLGFLAA